MSSNLWGRLNKNIVQINSTGSTQQKAASKVKGGSPNIWRDAHQRLIRPWFRASACRILKKHSPHSPQLIKVTYKALIGIFSWPFARNSQEQMNNKQWCSCAPARFSTPSLRIGILLVSLIWQDLLHERLISHHKPSGLKSCCSSQAKKGIMRQTFAVHRSSVWNISWMPFKTKQNNSKVLDGS